MHDTLEQLIEGGQWSGRHSIAPLLQEVDALLAMVQNPGSDPSQVRVAEVIILASVLERVTAKVHLLRRAALSELPLLRPSACLSDRTR